MSKADGCFFLTKIQCMDEDEYVPICHSRSPLAGIYWFYWFPAFAGKTNVKENVDMQIGASYPIRLT